MLAVVTGIVVLSVKSGGTAAPGRATPPPGGAVAVAPPPAPPGVDLTIEMPGVPEPTATLARNRFVDRLRKAGYRANEARPMVVTLKTKAEAGKYAYQPLDEDGDPDGEPIDIAVPWADVHVVVRRAFGGGGGTYTLRFRGAPPRGPVDRAAVQAETDRLSWGYFPEAMDDVPLDSQELIDKGGGTSWMGEYLVSNTLGRQPAAPPPIGRYFHLLDSPRLWDELKLTLEQRVELAVLYGSLAGYVPDKTRRARPLATDESMAAAIAESCRRARGLLAPDQLAEVRRVAKANRFAPPAAHVTDVRDTSSPADRFPRTLAAEWKCRIDVAPYGPPLALPAAPPVSLDNKAAWDDAAAEACFSLAERLVRGPDDVAGLIPSKLPNVRAFVDHYLLKHAGGSAGTLLAAVKKDLGPWAEVLGDARRDEATWDRVLAFVAAAGREQLDDLFAIASSNSRCSYGARRRLVKDFYGEMQAYAKAEGGKGQFSPPALGLVGGLDPNDPEDKQLGERVEALRKIHADAYTAYMLTPRPGARVAQPVRPPEPEWDKIVSSLRGEGPWDAGSAVGAVMRAPAIPDDRRDAVRTAVRTLLPAKPTWEKDWATFQALMRVAKKEDAAVAEQVMASLPADQRRGNPLPLLCVALCDPDKGLRLIDAPENAAITTWVFYIPLRPAEALSLGQTMLRSRHFRVREYAGTVLSMAGADAIPVLRRAVATEKDPSTRDVTRVLLDTLLKKQNEKPGDRN